MKLVANGSIRLGSRRYAEGDEFDMPDRQLAGILVRTGKAALADDRPKKKAKAEKQAEEPPEDKKKKTYKTRQIKAEDGD